MNKTTLLVAGLGLLITTAAVSIATYAAPFNHFYDADKFTAINEALASGDYAAWMAAIGGDRRFGDITEENFDQFAEMHRLLQAGDTEGAKAIAEQLGIEPGEGGPGLMFRHGLKQGEFNSRISQ